MSNWLNKYNWDENIPSPVSAVDLAKFQKSLDEVVGVDADGTNRWRIVWGQNLDASIEWDRYVGRWMPRYRWKSFLAAPLMNHDTGILERRTDWIGVPRYFIEALVYRSADKEESERAGVDSMKVIDPDTKQEVELDGQVYTERRVVGADYVTMMAVCMHDIKKDANGWRACCLRQARQGTACFGRYRPPDQMDVEQLTEDYHERIVSKVCVPGERLTDHDKQYLYQAWFLNQLREKNAIDQELDERRKAHLKFLLPWRNKTEWGAKKNHYSIPGQ